MRERLPSLGVASATAWMDDRTDYDGEFGEVTFREAYDDCCRWHENRGLPRPSKQALGTALSRKYAKRTATTRKTMWTLKLKPRPSREENFDSPNVPNRSAAGNRTGIPRPARCRD